METITEGNILKDMIGSPHPLLPVLSPTTSPHNALRRAMTNPESTPRHLQHLSTGKQPGIIDQGIHRPCIYCSNQMTQIGEYEILEPIGFGAYSHVLLGQRTGSQEKVVIKLMSKKSLETISLFKKEQSVLKVLNYVALIL